MYSYRLRILHTIAAFHNISLSGAIIGLLPISRFFRFAFICAFTLVACSGQQTNEPLTLGVNAIITEIDKENKIITTKDSGEEGVLGDDCLIDCSQIPMIYCNYDTQDVIDITLDDLQVGDEIILTIRSSEIENLQKEDDNKAKIAVEQLQLGTQRIK